MTLVRRVACATLLLAAVSMLALVIAKRGYGQASALRFEVSTSFPSASGRLFVVISKTERPEPRNTIGQMGMHAATVLARDVSGFRADVAVRSARH